MQQVGYHHIVWKQLFQIPLKYFQQVLTDKEKPCTYEEFIKNFPKYQGRKFIETLIEWIKQYDSPQNRFDLDPKGKEKQFHSGMQGENAENFLKTKLFQQLLHRMIVRKEVSQTIGLIRQTMNKYDNSGDQFGQNKTDLFFDSRCKWKEAISNRKSKVNFDKIKKVAQGRFLECLKFIQQIPHPKPMNIK